MEGRLLKRSQKSMVLMSSDSLTSHKRGGLESAKLPGNEISVPINPTSQNIKEDITRMLDNGTLTLGEPCVPHDVVKTKITNGNVEKETIVVYGCKFPLKVIRQNLLKSHENLMYLQTDDEIDLLSYTEVQEYFSKLHIETDDSDIQQSKEKMKVYQRSRYFAFWHDHSTILGVGYIMMTVHVLFDPGVFKQFNDQNRIEDPQLYMLYTRR